MRKIGRSLLQAHALPRATRQLRLKLAKANWFRPGDLPEPLDIAHFPPKNNDLSSNTGDLPRISADKSGSDSNSKDLLLGRFSDSRNPRKSAANYLRGR